MNKKLPEPLMTLHEILMSVKMSAREKQEKITELLGEKEDK